MLGVDARFAALAIANDTRGNARHDCVGRGVPGDNCSRRNDGSFADRDSVRNRRMGADPGAVCDVYAAAYDWLLADRRAAAEPVIACGDDYVRAEQNSTADPHWPRSQNDTVAVGKSAFSQLDVSARCDQVSADA